MDDSEFKTEECLVVCLNCKVLFLNVMLAQMHVNTFHEKSKVYCPDCKSGFNNELRLNEHHTACEKVLKTKEEEAGLIGWLATGCLDCNGIFLHKTVCWNVAEESKHHVDRIISQTTRMMQMERESFTTISFKFSFVNSFSVGDSLEQSFVDGYSFLGWFSAMWSHGCVLVSL